MLSYFKGAVGALAIACTAGAAVAQATDAHLALELNAVEPAEGGCRLSFVIQHSYTADITSAVFEAVLFDGEGRVDRLTLFDMGALPQDRPRVRQFVVPDLACETLGRLLINGVESCVGDGLPADACTRDLELRSRADVEVLG